MIPQPKILVCGEAWGRDEAREKRAFVGASGRLLRETLNSVGIDSDKVHYTNIINDQPPSNELLAWFDSKTGMPNEKVLGGLTSLRAEIEDVNPDLIIPVGNYPLRFLGGVGRWSKDGPSGIGDYRGYLLTGTALAGGRRVFPTYHPAAAVRQYSLKHIIRTDFRKALRHVGQGPVQRPRKAIVVDPGGADGDAWANWLVSPPGTTSPRINWAATEGPPDNEGWSGPEFEHVVSGEFLSSDIEFIGSKLLCVGFTRHRDVSIVYSTPTARSISRVRDILLCGIPLCFQNGMFDCSILEYFYDIKCFKYLQHDTMYAMHAAYIELKKDLGFIGSLFTDAWPWWQHVDKKFWSEVREGKRSIRDVLPYNGSDVWVTHQGMESLLTDELTDPDVYRTYQHELSLVRPLWKTANRGVLIDTAKIETLKGTLQHEADAFCYGIRKYNDDVEVNVRAPRQVATFLYTKMGVPKLGAKTPGGEWKMDDTTLATLILKCSGDRQRTAIRMVREARERLSLISKFCDIELDDDGRMRCHYDPAKTDTGRLSSRKFYPTGRGTNLQNVPRDTRVRAVFVPDKGHIFGYADLKSAESMVVAHITGDLEMLRLHSPEYMDGTKDGHKYVASFLLQKPIDLITKEERYLGKRVRHAGNYGMSWLRLMTMINADAQETGVSIDAVQAKALIWKYRQLHPMLPNWWAEVQAELWRSHTLYTCHRRKRVFYDRPDAILPEAIAYNPQGTIADTLNMGLLRVAADEVLANLGFELLLQVHDAIGFQVPEANAEAALRRLPGLLDIPISINRRGTPTYEIHVPVEIQVGYNWGEFDPKKPEENPNGLRSWKAAA